MQCERVGRAAVVHWDVVLDGVEAMGPNFA